MRLGEICREDKEENELSLREGFRLLSAYEAEGAAENMDDHGSGPFSNDGTVYG